MAVMDDLGSQALAASPSGAAGLLDSIVGYYPSGTRIVQGSRVDRILERHRAFIVQRIIIRLRSETGLDLGPAPEPWIKHFAKP